MKFVDGGFRRPCCEGLLQLRNLVSRRSVGREVIDVAQESGGLPMEYGR